MSWCFEIYNSTEKLTVKFGLVSTSSKFFGVVKFPLVIFYGISTLLDDLIQFI